MTREAQARTVRSFLALAVFFAPASLWAQGEGQAVQADTPERPTETLAVQQQQVAGQFGHLEEVLSRMAELSGVTDQRRAALLKRAVLLSKDRRIRVQFEGIAELLEKDSLSRAIEHQDLVQQDLKALLELLLSENRARRVESEQARIRRYLKELNRIIKQEKSIQGRTAGTGDVQGLSAEQGELAKQTGDLAEEIKTNEEGQGSGQPSQTADEESEDTRGNDREQPGQPDDTDRPNEEDPARKGSKQQDDARGTPGEGGQQQREGQPGQEQSEGQGSQQQSQEQAQAPDQSQGGGPQQAQDQNPVRGPVEAARQRMRHAQRKLEEAERQGAVEEQEEAIRQLEQAKAELEKILRQLREEEIERVLAMLEERFVKMLEMQREVYEGTKRLDEVPQAQRDRNHEIEASRLSRREADIVMEADKAWSLLREDGSALAFPEAVQQMRDDMEQVVEWLGQAKVDSMTQGIEEDIIAALEEMIDALQKAIKDAEDRRRQLPNLPAQNPQDPALVDVLAELKMIRALQMRVNRRTERYSKLIDGEQAERPDLLEALDQLGGRQERIFRITRDLHLGRNR
jgi:hypothetical protein